MVKARHIMLQLPPEDCLRLKDLQSEAARCWNFIVRTAKEHYRETGKWISKGELQKLTKNQFKLHSQTVQALTDKFDESRQAAASHRRSGNKLMKYPWREKKFCTIPFKQMAIRLSPKGTLVLSLSAGKVIHSLMC